jgi:hypothetical protein
VFPVRYEQNSNILCIRYSVVKDLMNVIQLTTSRKIIVVLVYSENELKLINSIFARIFELLNVKPGGMHVHHYKLNG